jgi:hypothetical protein
MQRAKVTARRCVTHPAAAAGAAAPTCVAKGKREPRVTYMCVRGSGAAHRRGRAWQRRAPHLRVQIVVHVGVGGAHRQRKEDRVWPSESSDEEWRIDRPIQRESRRHLGAPAEVLDCWWPAAAIPPKLELLRWALPLGAGPGRDGGRARGRRPEHALGAQATPVCVVACSRRRARRHDADADAVRPRASASAHVRHTVCAPAGLRRSRANRG